MLKSTLCGLLSQSFYVAACSVQGKKKVIIFLWYLHCLWVSSVPGSSRALATPPSWGPRPSRRARTGWGVPTPWSRTRVRESERRHPRRSSTRRGEKNLFKRVQSYSIEGSKWGWVFYDNGPEQKKKKRGFLFISLPLQKTFLGDARRAIKWGFFCPKKKFFFFLLLGLICHFISQCKKRDAYLRAELNSFANQFDFLAAVILLHDRDEETQVRHFFATFVPA